MDALFSCSEALDGKRWPIIFIERQAQIWGWIEGVGDFKFVEVLACAAVFDDRKMQMHTDRVDGVPRVIPLVAQQGAGFDKYFACAGRKIRGDQGTAIGVGHVGVIGPNLMAGLQRIGRDADDQGGFPIGLAAEITIVGSIDRGDANISAGENINTLVAVIDLERIIPQVADQSVGGHDERRIVASG